MDPQDLNAQRKLIYWYCLSRCRQVGSPPHHVPLKAPMHLCVSGCFATIKAIVIMFYHNPLCTLETMILSTFFALLQMAIWDVPQCPWDLPWNTETLTMGRKTKQHACGSRKKKKCFQQ